MCKVSSYLKIEELVHVSWKSCAKVVGLLNVCALISLIWQGVHGLDSREKYSVFYRNQRGKECVSRIRIFWAACLNLVKGLGKCEILSDLLCWHVCGMKFSYNFCDWSVLLVNELSMLVLCYLIGCGLVLKISYA